MGCQTKHGFWELLLGLVPSVTSWQEPLGTQASPWPRVLGQAQTRGVLNPAQPGDAPSPARRVWLPTTAPGSLLAQAQLQDRHSSDIPASGQWFFPAGGDPRGTEPFPRRGGLGSAAPGRERAQCVGVLLGFLWRADPADALGTRLRCKSEQCHSAGSSPEPQPKFAKFAPCSISGAHHSSH